MTSDDLPSKIPADQVDPLLSNSIEETSNFSRDSQQIDLQLAAAITHQPKALNFSVPDSILQSKSSDSSFTRNFTWLLEQSEGLKI